VREEVTMLLSHVQIRRPQQEMPRPAQEMHQTRHDPALVGAESRPEPAMAGAAPAARPAAQPGCWRTPVAERDPKAPATWGSIGRNAACPCGSGKKYKHCHGSLV